MRARRSFMDVAKPAISCRPKPIAATLQPSKTFN